MRLLFLNSVLGLVLVATPVLAQGADESKGVDAVTQAERHSQLGVEFYKEGRYPEAIREMLAAYQAVPDSMLLYNVARIYEAMGQSALAVDYFTRFVKAEDADPDTVQQALERMESIQSGGVSEDSTSSDPGGSDSGGEGDSSGSSASIGQSPADPAAEAGSAVDSAAVRTSAAAMAPYVGVAAGVTAISGAVLAVTGITALGLYGMSRDESHNYDARLAYQADAAGLAIAADVALGFTAAAAVTTGILAIVSKLQANRVAWAPLGPHGSVGMTLVLEFEPSGRPVR